MNTVDTTGRNRFLTRHDGIFEISGKLTFESVPEFLTHTQSLFSGPDGPVTIDMKSVTKADSAGLALMVEWLRLARRAQREIKFINIPSQARKIITVSGLQRAFL